MAGSSECFRLIEIFHREKHQHFVSVGNLKNFTRHGIVRQYIFYVPDGYDKGE